MKIILETPRLLLRELTIDDAVYFFGLNANPNVIRYTGDAAFKDIDEAQTFLQNYKDYKTNGYGRWAVIAKSGGTFLGWCGLKYSKASDETDIGFRFFEQYWNQGYATESALACLNYGFNELELNTIVGRAMEANIGSLRVLEKIGMTYEREFDFDGADGVIFSIGKTIE